MKMKIKIKVWEKDIDIVASGFGETITIVERLRFGGWGRERAMEKIVMMWQVT